MRCGQKPFFNGRIKHHASRITCFTLSFSSRSPTRRARPASPEAPRARRARARSRPPSTGCAPPQSWTMAKRAALSSDTRHPNLSASQAGKRKRRERPFARRGDVRAPITARLASVRAILYPKSVRRSSHTRAPRGAHAHPPILVPPPASPVIASSIALIADRPPFPSLRSARPPHFPFDPHTKNTMAFTSTAARLPGSLRAEAKPSRTGKSARRLTPRRAIAEPAKAASSKFTPAWKLQVRSRPNRPTSVPKRRASAPTSSADRKSSLLQPIAADASPLSPIFPSAIRPNPP